MGTASPRLLRFILSLWRSWWAHPSHSYLVTEHQAIVHKGEKRGWRRERREGKLQSLPIKLSEYVTSQISPEVSAIKHSERKQFCFCLSDIVSKKQRKGVVSVRRLPSKRLQTEPCPCPRCCHFWSLSLLD